MPSPNYQTAPALFQARHYNTTARILKDAEAKFTSDAQRTAIAYIRQEFTQMYRQDNPRFDLERFLEASSL